MMSLIQPSSDYIEWTGPVWKPMHLQPVFEEYRVYGGEVSARLFDRGLCMPSGSSLDEEGRARVIAGVCEAFGAGR